MEVRNIPISQIKWIRSEEERKKAPAGFFLLPGERKFPIKNKDGSLNCNLVRAAITRAAQYGYSSVEAKARRLYEEYCKVEESDSLINVIAFDELETEGGFWHNILPIKKFYHPRYGVINITRELVQQMADNFQKGIPHYEPSLYLGHDDRKAYGAIKKVEVRDDGLWAFIVPDFEGKDLIKRKKFKYLSAEFVDHYLDKDSGKDAGGVILGVALTNTPAHPSMTPITAFSENLPEDLYKFDDKEVDDMDFKELYEEARKKLEDVENEKKQLSEQFKALEEAKVKLEQELAEVKKELEEKEAKLFEERKEAWGKAWIAKGVAPAVIDKFKKLSESEDDLKKFDEVLAAMPKIQTGQAGSEEPANSYEEEGKEIAKYAK